MNKLKIYIVEDEPLILMNLKMALKKRGITVIGSSDEYDEAIEDINKLKPTLVLLDIQLESEKDGVNIANYLDKLNVHYMYITSQTDPDTLARVKETNPLGYIVKPFTEAGLLSNIELAWHSISKENEEVIHIKSDGKKITINQASIQYLKAFDNYCYIITATNQYIVPHTLKHTSEMLNQKHFFQSHRSYWVNLRKISAIKADCILIENHQIPLSYGNKKALKKILNL
ncbi:transcriptional regulator [unidentified eubacterium SCB49]|nr:transcriptional regulator [unidentified eubacterium SCB49]